MPMTLSCIPPVVPWAAAAGGAAARLLQAGHMVVPSAICVPHPLQKAMDFFSLDCATQPPDTVCPALSESRESYQNQPSKANRITNGGALARHHLVIEPGRAFAINTIAL